MFENHQKKSHLSQLTIFGIFNEFLSTQNVNVARFARNTEWDFFQWFSNTLSHYNFHPLFSRDLHSQEKVEEGVHLVCDARVSLMKVRQEEDSLSSIHWNKWTCESDFPISLESLVHWCAQKSINGIVLISTTIPRYVTLVVVDQSIITRRKWNDLWVNQY